MCNLYTMRRSTAEVAQLFNVASPAPANLGDEVYPGYPGLVVAEGQLQTMVWGFPLAMKGKQGQQLKPKPVNNTRTDKLDSGFWRPSFEARRCLIPLTAFAEAEGPKGAKTRTWLSLSDQPIFACAGIWRWSAEWGEVYSMVMTDACIQTKGIHGRMPVILKPDDWQRWTDAPADEARGLCLPYKGAVTIERTTQPWNSLKSG